MEVLKEDLKELKTEVDELPDHVPKLSIRGHEEFGLLARVIDLGLVQVQPSDIIKNIEKFWPSKHVSPDHITFGPDGIDLVIKVIQHAVDGLDGVGEHDSLQRDLVRELSRWCNRFRFAVVERLSHLPQEVEMEVEMEQEVPAVKDDVKTPTTPPLTPTLLRGPEMRSSSTGRFNSRRGGAFSVPPLEHALTNIPEREWGTAPPAFTGTQGIGANAFRSPSVTARSEDDDSLEYISATSLDPSDEDEISSLVARLSPADSERVSPRPRNASAGPSTAFNKHQESPSNELDPRRNQIHPSLKRRLADASGVRSDGVRPQRQRIASPDASLSASPAFAPSGNRTPSPDLIAPSESADEDEEVPDGGYATVEQNRLVGSYRLAWWGELEGYWVVQILPINVKMWFYHFKRDKNLTTDLIRGDQGSKSVLCRNVPSDPEDEHCGNDFAWFDYDSLKDIELDETLAPGTLLVATPGETEQQKELRGKDLDLRADGFLIATSKDKEGAYLAELARKDAAMMRRDESAQLRVSQIIMNVDVEKAYRVTHTGSDHVCEGRCYFEMTCD